MPRFTLRSSAAPRRPDARVKHDAITRLATLVASGIPIGAALEAGGRAGGRTGALLARMSHTVARGRRLSHAMAAIVGCDATEVALVEAGEASGRLDRSLELLGLRLGHRAEFRHRLTRALIYPAILVALTVAIVTAMGIFVIPTFASMYDGLGVALPLSTRLIMTAADVTVSHGATVGLVTATLVVICYAAVHTQARLCVLMHAGLLGLPFFGRTVRASAKYDIYSTLAALLEAGVDLDRAIRLATPACANAELRRRLGGVGALVERGWLPSAAVVRAGLDPDGEDAGLIKTAEASGDYTACFAHLAAVARAERDERTETVTKLLEPAAVMLMALAVCATVVGIYQPILGSATLLIGDMK